jgi:2-polyprenyl-6-methoxyphenol hydroxylase-like FAD-dependent oxidoreductase
VDQDLMYLLVVERVSESSDIHRAPLQEVVLPAPWYEGSIVLTGDAADAVTPHLRRAPRMAMEDALVLADELGKDSTVLEALAAFMARRLPRVQFVLNQTHEILLNEMESEAAKKGAFAAGLGPRQAEITRVLSTPA